MTNVLPPKPLKVADVADYMGRSPEAIRRLIRTRKLEATKVGGVWLIQPKSIAILLKFEITII